MNNSHELVNLRVGTRGEIEVWALSSVTKDGASYRHLGTVSASIIKKAQAKAAKPTRRPSQRAS